MYKSSRGWRKVFSDVLINKIEHIESTQAAVRRKLLVRDLFERVMKPEKLTFKLIILKFTMAIKESIRAVFETAQ
jgi:hypothetical protein